MNNGSGPFHGVLVVNCFIQSVLQRTQVLYLLSNGVMDEIEKNPRFLKLLVLKFVNWGKKPFSIKMFCKNDY